MGSAGECSPSLEKVTCSGLQSQMSGLPMGVLTSSLGFLSCVTCLAGCRCPCWWGDTHTYTLLFAQPQSRDESSRCAELEEQIWQTVTLVRKHNPVPGDMMGRQGHACSQEQEVFAQSQTRGTVSLLTPEKNLGLENC